MSDVFIVGRSKMYGDDTDFQEHARKSGEVLGSGIQIVSAQTLGKLFALLERGRPDALVLKYYMESEDDELFRGCFGDGPKNSPLHNIGHLINATYRPDSINPDFLPLHGIPTLIYDGFLHTHRRLPPEALNHPNVYVNSDMIDERHSMGNLGIAPGSIGDRIVLQWVNKILNAK